MNNEYERYDFWNRELKEQRKDFIERIVDAEMDNKASEIESAYAEDSSEEKNSAL